jgi:hypothetical protein
MTMVEDANARNYRPLFVIDQYGVMKYVETPLFAGMEDRRLAPSVTPDLAVQPSLISPAN